MTTMVPAKAGLPGRRALLRFGALVAAAFVVSGCLSPTAPSEIALYDTHAHFFTPDTQRYPYDLRGAREGEDVLRARIAAAPNTPETVLSAWQANGVTGGVGVQYATVYKTDNRYLLDSADRFPGKIATVVILNPLAAETPAELRRMVREHGVSGIRITGNPDASGEFPWLNGPAAQNVWKAADDLRLAVVVMNLPSTLSPKVLTSVADMAARYPHTRVVIDHIGWATATANPADNLTAVRAALGDRPNVFFKFTTINVERTGSSAAAYLRQAVDMFGADRIMWGSDFGNSALPYQTMVLHAREAAAQLTPKEQRKLFHDTGYNIFRRR